MVQPKVLHFLFLPLYVSAQLQVWFGLDYDISQHVQLTLLDSSQIVQCSGDDVTSFQIEHNFIQFQSQSHPRM